MHNIKNLREDLEVYKKTLNRNFNFNTDLFNKLDNNNRKLINEKEKLEQLKKTLSKSKDKSNFENQKYLKKFQN